MTDLSRPHIAAEPNARAYANTAEKSIFQDKAHIAQLQADARAFAKTVAVKPLKFGYTPFGLYCYTDATGQPLYWKVRAQHHTFYDLPELEQQRVADAASANAHKWIRAISVKPDNTGFQLKEPDFNAIYPAGAGKKPLYNLAGIASAASDTVVWLFEGEQKADLANTLGLLASTCGGASSIESTHLEPLASRCVVIWPDHDEAGIKCRDSLMAALQGLGCNVSYVAVHGLGLPHKGDIVDWLAMQHVRGEIVTAAHLRALPVILYNGESQVLSGSNNRLPKGHLAEPLAYGGNDARFEILPNGIFYTSKDQHDNERSHFISSPILVIAKTRDSSSNSWGRLLHWHDDEGRLHQWAMPMQLLQGDGSDVRRELADQGAMISPEKKSRDLLAIYLGMYPADRFALCVDRLGWHGMRYVLPKITYGEQGEHITVFQNSSALSASFNQSGTLAEWQQHVSKACEPHSRLVFALSCAFAGQLLEPLNEQGGGFHLRGNSSSGKSTALKIAGSVWGNPDQIIHEWRATSNALEGIAALHNDSFLGLDEINQCDPRDIGNTVYMLSNGQGKARMQRTGGNRPTTQWRILFLSAGEQSLATLMAQVGKRTNAGQEVRLADIPADAGYGLGIFDGLTLSDDPAKQSDLIKQAALQYHGSAGHAWISHITKDKHELARQTRHIMSRFMQQHASNSTGQTARVATRFAVVAAAGEIATQAGLTGWQQGRAMTAMGQCFNDWLAGFGMVGNHEERSILAEVKAFFEMHGASRFENLQADPDRPEKVINRVGYFKYEGDQKLFYVYPEQFKTEICKGRDYRQVAKILKAVGWLNHDVDKLSKAVRLPDSNKTVRVYVFNGAMWQWDNDINPDVPKNKGNTGNKGNSIDNEGLQPVTHFKSEKVTGVTQPLTTARVTQKISSVTCAKVEQVTDAKSNKIRPVTPATLVTVEKQSIQTVNSNRVIL